MSPSNPKPRSSRAPSKWQDVLSDIDRRLANGEFQPGQKFGTLRMIVDHYNVSDITARRVFRELKKQGLLISRGCQGTFVANQQEKQPIIFCVRTQGPAASNNDLFATQSLINFVSEFRLSPMAENYELKPVSMEFCLEHLEAIQDQVMLVAAHTLLEINNKQIVIDRDRLALLRKHATPIVIQALPGITEDVDRISSDMRGGICKVVHHLVAQGHRRLAYLTDNLSNPWFKPRFEGFFDTLAEYGLECDPKLIEVTPAHNQLKVFEAVERLMNQPSPPTALVCATDARAIDAVAYCKKNKLRIPEDLAITGFDNNPEASLCNPSLTTVDGLDSQMSEQAFALALKRLHKIDNPPAHIILSPKLIIRQSG